MVRYVTVPDGACLQSHRNIAALSFGATLSNKVSSVSRRAKSELGSREVHCPETNLSRLPFPFLYCRSPIWWLARIRTWSESGVVGRQSPAFPIDISHLGLPASWTKRGWPDIALAADPRVSRATARMDNQGSRPGLLVSRVRSALPPSFLGRPNLTGY